MPATRSRAFGGAGAAASSSTCSRRETASRMLPRSSASNSSPSPLHGNTCGLRRRATATSRRPAAISGDASSTATTRAGEVRDESKFGSLIEFGDALPRIRKQVDTDLARSGLPREKVLATVVRLLDLTAMRIGNGEYTRANRSYGLTTLQDRHATFAPGTVSFGFRGKGRQETRHRGARRTPRADRPAVPRPARPRAVSVPR